ncbi:MAG: hypothetical protein M3454_12040 [Actinomycetota bacterium]|nr:hypothetical protein [Actinomycetota bacterium]
MGQEFGPIPSVTGRPWPLMGNSKLLRWSASVTMIEKSPREMSQGLLGV